MPRKPSCTSRISKSEPPQNKRRRIDLLLFIICSALLLTGCAGYQLGPTNGLVARSKSIRIDLFQNDTYEPRLSESLGTAIRRSVQRDGTYRLATGDGADVVVEGVIFDFRRSGLTYQPADILTVRDYDLTMRVRIKATEVSTGRVIFNQPVSGRTTIRAGNDLSSAERQAVPLMAEDLARNFTSLLVDGTW